MRRILVCTGVLGGGTAVVFAAAALASVLIPPGQVVPVAPMIFIERPQVMPVPALPVGAGGALSIDAVVSPEAWAEAPAPATERKP